ncbi:hypothetical protein [Streptomyces sp. NPDC048521]|uniref:hypothetical protein n=1 Tax=Streptomyces sp. NPDC048521 TaxID=3365566 RepID=UPI00371AC94A
MFSSQKTATVAALVGGLAALCIGAGHAYADEKPDDCQTTEQGGTVCIRKSETYIDKDGKHVVKQDQDCSTTDRSRVEFQEDRLLGGESSPDRPVVDCSNTAKLPEGFKKPHIEL